MGLRCDFTVSCDGCGKKREHAEQVVANQPMKVSGTFDPTRAVLHREAQFYAFGHAMHICGGCANEIALAGLLKLKEIKGASNAGA